MQFQNLSQKQQLKIFPQQLQLLHLFHLNSIELEQHIKQELEENPMLEKASEFEAQDEAPGDTDEWGDPYSNADDVPDYKLETRQSYKDRKLPERTLEVSSDFRKEATNQLNLLPLSEADKALGEFLIYCLSESGLFESTAEELAEDYSLRNTKWLDVSEVERVIGIIQQLDPPGIGAFSVKECLLIQLKRMDKKCPIVKAAIRMLEDHYNDLKDRNFTKIHEALEADEDSFKAILTLIGSLKFKPVAVNEDAPPQLDTIIPDFLLIENEDGLDVSLARESSPFLGISSAWRTKVNQIDKGKNRREAQYLKNKLNSAEWFISAIRQRESTMLRVMRAILRHQYEYFMTGDKSVIRPMILKDIADVVGVNISTVSRITCNKYIQTIFGNILLKDLFNEGLMDQDGEKISVKKIHEVLEKVIEEEDKHSPLSDQQLVQLLSEHGFKIARRTVAKYRKELKIPTAQYRSLLA